MFEKNGARAIGSGDGILRHSRWVSFVVTERRKGWNVSSLLGIYSTEILTIFITLLLVFFYLAAITFLVFLNWFFNFFKFVFMVPTFFTQNIIKVFERKNSNWSLKFKNEQNLQKRTILESELKFQYFCYLDNFRPNKTDQIFRKNRDLRYATVHNLYRVK